jgi:hypothetical protein
MRRALLLIPLAILLAGACSSQPSEEIPTGVYSGSTAGDVAVTISVGGSAIQVNNKKTDLVSIDDNRAFVVNREPEQRATFVDRSEWECDPALDGDELHCTVTWANGESERIELMRE